MTFSRDRSKAPGDRQCQDDPRSVARQLAVQFLYQLGVQGSPCLNQLESFLAEHTDDDKIRKLAKIWVEETWQHRDAIDNMIQATSENWDLNRINQVDHSNLRLAVYQLMKRPDIPMKVVINEAIELARKFSTAQAPMFINGVLDAIQHRLTGGDEAKP